MTAQYKSRLVTESRSGLRWKGELPGRKPIELVKGVGGKGSQEAVSSRSESTLLD